MRRIAALLQRDWIPSTATPSSSTWMEAPILIPFLLCFVLPATWQAAIYLVLTEEVTAALRAGWERTPTSRSSPVCTDKRRTQLHNTKRMDYLHPQGMTNVLGVSPPIEYNLDRDNP